MKSWKKPEFEELAIAMTAQAYYVNIENEDSGEPEWQEDLGTCHNNYWEGNGLTKDEAQANNPYWHGGWGQN